MQIITEMKEAQRIYPNRWPDHVLSSSATRPNLSKRELAPSNRFLTEVPSIKIQTMEAHTHTHPFNGPLSGTTRVGWYQKGKTKLDFTEARDSE